MLRQEFRVAHGTRPLTQPSVHCLGKFACRMKPTKVAKNAQILTYRLDGLIFKRPGSDA
jgi:hypothetical protein